MPPPPMPVSQPQELPVAPTQPDMPERHSEYGIPLWMQLGAGPERDAAYAQYMKAQRGEMQPKFIGKNFTGDAPPPGKKYIETSEGLVPVPINDVPVKPAMGPGLGGSLGMPMQGVGMAPPMPSAPPQAPLFNRNASLKQLNETFGNLRNTYGEDALRAAGLTPSVFQGFQKTMRELQLNNNSTQDQHTAALQNAYNTMNSFTNNLKPRQLPAPPMALPGGTGYDEQGNMIRSNPNNLSGVGGLLSKFAEQFRNAESMPKTYTSAPRQLTQEEILGITSMPQRPQGVGMAPQMPQGMTLSNVPQQGVAPQPVSAPQGMAMGGLLRKYYGGGMC